MTKVVIIGAANIRRYELEQLLAKEYGLEMEVVENHSLQPEVMEIRCREFEPMPKPFIKNERPIPDWRGHGKRRMPKR